MPASEVFHKWGQNELHSGSKSGPIVKNQKQAVAIYLSEKRKEAQHGGKYPEKRADGGNAPPPKIFDPEGRPGWPPLEPISPEAWKAYGVATGQKPPKQMGGPAGMGVPMAPQFPQGFGGGQMPPMGLPSGTGTGGMGRGFQFGGSPTNMGLTPGWIERSEARNLGRTHLGPIMSTVGGRTDNHAISVPSGSYVLPAAHVSALGQGNSLNGMKVLQGMFGPSMSSPPPGVSPMRGDMHSAALRPPPMPRAIRQQADGGNVLSFPSRSSLLDKELAQSPDQVAKNRTSRILNQVLEPPNVLPMTPNDGSSSGGSRGDAHVGKPVPIMAAGGEYVLSPQQVMRGPLKNPWNLSLDDGHKVLDHWVKKTHKKYAKTVANLPPPAKT